MNNNIDEYDSYLEKNEINQNILSDYSNSMPSDQDNSNYDENSSINGIENGANNKINYNFELKKNYNTIDFLNFNDGESKKQQCYKKIEQMLKDFNKLLPEYIIKQIIVQSYNYQTKFPKKKLATIVPIVTYKIIKKNNIKTVSLKDLKSKFKFKLKTYFKNEKLFSELNPKVEHKIINLKGLYKNSINYTINHKSQSFSDLVLDSLKKSINKIKDKIKLNINIIKPKNIKKLNNKERTNNKISNGKKIELIYTNISENENNIKKLYYNPVIEELDNCLAQCESLIYNSSNKEDSVSDTNITNQTINIREDDTNRINGGKSFNYFFENKIDNENLALGLLKYYIDQNNVISLSYNKLNELLNCNIYRIKKSILYIKEYFNKYINNID